ncbi:MAG: 3-phosphoshikimate 1-carboxyvinyltransferase [Abditibacteriales bacterium]|nr:3-phosphoshikimate 1-carboxyvinyltransferase [Abditibacteriales bacterium]MDW8366341.1 3-phosphoshikimate 1-carboxyvinyltransferase [Abditibacteriales bacterium]
MTIRKATQLLGDIAVPGDKSITHRAALLGALAHGATVIHNFLVAEDCLCTLRCLQQMGIAVEGMGTREVVVQGKGIRGLREPRDVLDVGNSGTLARLMLGVLAGQPFEATVTGDASIQRRPMDRVATPLRQMGAIVQGQGERCTPPVTIRGGILKPITYTTPVASAQVKSAILLAGLNACGRTTVMESGLSRDHSERMLRAFGADIAVERANLPTCQPANVVTTISIQGPAELHAQEVTVPGDLSSAAFFLVGAAMLPGSEVRVRGVGVNPTRTGVLDVLREMGADVRLENERETSGEPVADVVVRHAPLRGVTIGGDLIPRLIDELPILAVAACCADGITVVRDAKELRVKESDRIATMTSELRKMGARIAEREDGWVIEGPNQLKGATVQSHGDHRVAMSCAIAALAAEGETVIEDTACIATSFPEFEEILERLRAS